MRVYGGGRIDGRSDEHRLGRGLGLGRTMPLRCASIDGISDMPELGSEIEERHENNEGGHCPEHKLECCPQSPDDGHGDAWLDFQRECGGEHFFQNEMNQSASLLRYVLVREVRTQSVHIKACDDSVNKHQDQVRY